MTTFTDDLYRGDEFHEEQGIAYQTETYLLDEIVYESMENLIDELKKWQYDNM